MKKMNRCLLVVALFFGGLTIGQAAVVWDYTIDGPLSINPAAPTLINLVDINNTVLGHVGGGGFPGPSNVYNAISFEVPSGNSLLQIRLDNYAGGSTAFRGNTGPVSFLNTVANACHPGCSDLTNGYVTISGGSIGNNLISFSSPLPPGLYTVVFQEGSPNHTYELNFILASSPVPPPIPTMSEWGLISFALLLCSMVSIALYRRRKHVVA